MLVSLLVLLRSATCTEKGPADRPSDIQWAPKLRAQRGQVTLKVIHISKCAPLARSRSRLVRSPLFGFYVLVYFGSSLAAFWFQLDTLSVPLLLVSISCLQPSHIGIHVVSYTLLPGFNAHLAGDCRF